MHYILPKKNNHSKHKKVRKDLFLFLSVCFLTKNTKHCKNLMYVCKGVDCMLRRCTMVGMLIMTKETFLIADNFA